MSMKQFLIISLIFVSFNSEAKNVALLLSGTGSVPGPHEFLSETSASAICLKDRGFEVSVMAGGPISGQHANTMEEDKPHYKDDFAFLSRLAQEGKINKDSLTEETLRAKLHQLLQDLKSGDTFELQVSAHGSILCGPRDSAACASQTNRTRECESKLLEPGQTPEDFPDLDCKHKLKIAGVPVDTEIITNFVSELDRKNVKVNYLNKACFSGFEKPRTKDLQNTCTYFSAGDRNVGMGCAEVETPAEQLITTTNANSAVFSRACQGREGLLSDPYFQSKKCIQGQLNHLRSLSATTSIADLFMDARQRDRNGTNPNLSCLSFDHLDQDVMASTLFNLSRKPQPIDLNSCAMAVEKNLETMIGDIDEILTASRPSLAAAINRYHEAIEAYTTSVESQRPLLEPCLSGGAQKCSQMKVFQQATAENSQAVIDAERSLFSELRNSRPELFAGCQSSPCSRELPN